MNKEKFEELSITTVFAVVNSDVDAPPLKEEDIEHRFSDEDLRFVGHLNLGSVLVDQSRVEISMHMRVASELSNLAMKRMESEKQVRKYEYPVVMMAPSKVRSQRRKIILRGFQGYHITDNWRPTLQEHLKMCGIVLLK